MGSASVVALTNTAALICATHRRRWPVQTSRFKQITRLAHPSHPRSHPHPESHLHTHQKNVTWPNFCVSEQTKVESPFLARNSPEVPAMVGGDTR